MGLGRVAGRLWALFGLMVWVLAKRVGSFRTVAWVGLLLRVGFGCLFVVALLGCLGLFSLTCYSGALVFYWFLGLVLVLFNCDLGFVALLLCYLCCLGVCVLVRWFELGF